MMKKIIALVIALSIIAGTFIFMSCGSASAFNVDIFDTNYKYNKAIIGMPDGTHMELDVKQWRDYEDGEQLQITDSNGDVYLVSSFNCILINEKEG